MTNEIKIGDKIPTFTAQSHDGFEVDEEDIIGNPFVLYFYAKDDTPGCSSQACSFRDNMETFDHLNIAVIGISADSRESHVKFMTKNKLNFLLLSDENLVVAKKFGVVQEGEKKVTRTTFIVDSDGFVRWIEKPVNVEGHSERVLEAIKGIFKKRTSMILEDISVTVLAKNSEKYLKEVLKSLSSFGEVILYDTGSTDSTLSIAQSFPNVKVTKAQFIGFGPTHNLASAAAKNNWILSVDSDEIVTTEMVKAIANVNTDIQSVYSFQRHNYFNGKFIKWCGWYPDRQIRLYNRTKTKFSDDQVHESIISEKMRLVSLEAPFIHYSYESISDFLAKMQSYSTLFAKQNQGKKKSSISKALAHGWFAFFKSYILKRGFLGGYEGYIISAYNGHTAYYKYLKLYEANKKLNQ